MRVSGIGVTLIGTILLGTGCKKNPSLVGKWTSTVNGIPVSVEFKPDNTMITDTRRGPLDVVVTQSYTLDGNKATFTAKDIEIRGMPPGRESQLDALKRSQIGKSDTEILTFASDDEVTLTGKIATTLTRVKE